MGTTAIQRPTLIDGAHLDVDEFLERWDAMPDIKFAELIDGVVYMASPVGRAHSVFHSEVSDWLGVYLRATKGTMKGIGGSWIMGSHVTQPDLVFGILPEYGGTGRPAKSLQAGAPELVVEISVSTRKYDSGRKLDIYREQGVQEYIVVDQRKQRIAWYDLRSNPETKLAQGADGIIRSAVFPGLWLDCAALFRSDSTQLMAVLSAGLATLEHAAFVKQIEAKHAEK